MGNKPRFTEDMSDGCDFISKPYKFLTGKKYSFHNCCVNHDKRYYYGGTHKKRLEADTELRDCVNSYGNNRGFFMKSVYFITSRVFYIAVRIFGSPKLGLKWAWPLRQ